jgi:hypothetical protein
MVNIADVFNYEFPTTLYVYSLRHNFIGVTLIAFVILIFLYEYPVPLLCTFPLYLCIGSVYLDTLTQETRLFSVLLFCFEQGKWAKRFVYNTGAHPLLPL